MPTDRSTRDERLRRLAEELRRASAPPAPATMTGRGIVVAAGGARIFTNAYVLLHVLRHALGSRLPVELWYFGQAEISPAMAALLASFDVHLVDAIPIIEATGAAVRDGWQLKSFALLHSRFSEVLLLDADQVPIVDPQVLFDWPEYAATGAVFWPDMVDLRADNVVWEIMGLPPRRTVSFESGQLLVDRRRHMSAIWAAARLNEAADDLYQLIYGDKDSFLLAWGLMGATFSLVPHRPFADDFYMVQRDFAGEPLFQHLCNAKWQYGAAPRQLPELVHRDACLAAMAELQSAWSGEVFTPPDRSAAARLTEFEMIQQAQFELHVLDEAPILLELRAHAEIGAGRAHDRRNWWVDGDAAHITLVLGGRDRRSYELTRHPDGTWQGTRQRYPRVGVSLAPVTLDPPAPRNHAVLVDDLLRAGGLHAPSPEGLKRLADSLILLSQVIPGVADRIHYLAAAETEPLTKTHLEELAASVLASERPPTTLVTRPHVLTTGYQKMDQR